MKFKVLNEILTQPDSKYNELQERVFVPDRTVQDMTVQDRTCDLSHLHAALLIPT